ncbi:hypothetical protein J5226_07260 [Lysobacter sp. K5869]|uniref:hypothetical protein n=1 Tax=Lysobacter sp. K5869 TaxID=2820808 RepID=UPI001C064815|nr:hypothetical protein [Lysobacter sp. K5869]QWP78187.1 hypothetical protein J5226_07260 [Lysobacter sp. K5869]
MIPSQVHQEVARLSGYLDGIAVSTNYPRRYCAGAFLIEPVAPDACIEQAIRDYKKSWCPDLAFDSRQRQRLPSGLSSLESDIQPLVLREAPGLDAVGLENLRKYLSFKVMDALWYALEHQGGLRLGPWNAVEVWRLESPPEPDSSDCIYFCVRVEQALVVLQFNDDLKWRQAVESGRIDPAAQRAEALAQSG